MIDQCRNVVVELEPVPVLDKIRQSWIAVKR